MCKSPFAIRLHPRYPISLKLDRCPYFIIISRFDFKLWCCDTKEKTNYLPYFAGGIPRIGLPLLDFVVLHGKVIMNWSLMCQTTTDLRNKLQALSIKMRTVSSGYVCTLYFTKLYMDIYIIYYYPRCGLFGKNEWGERKMYVFVDFSAFQRIFYFSISRFCFVLIVRRKLSLYCQLWYRLL